MNRKAKHNLTRKA